MEQELRDYLDRQFVEAREGTNQQFAEANRQFAEARDETNRRFAEVGAKMDRRFEAIDRQYAELRQEVHEIGILFEELGSRFQAIAEGVDNNTQQTKRLVAEVRRDLSEARAPMEGALKDLGPRVTKHDRQLQEHGQRLSALESAAA